MAEHSISGNALGFEAITVSTSAIGITDTLLSPTSGDQGQATWAMLTVEAQSLRYRTDGTDPTASVGHLASAGDIVLIRGLDALKKLRMIRSGGSDSTVHVTTGRVVES